MCGIAGSLVWDKSNNEEYRNLNKVTSFLNHRGPNFSKVKKMKNIVLAHSRLAIIDLNNSANQPMFDTSGKFCITYNGEIYNFLEIKKNLIRKGVYFKTNSDTEVILESYKMWNEKCLNFFEGMFAFAIWDIKKQKLFVARDRIGEKPLFYYPYDGKTLNSGIIFSSEIRSLLKHPNVKFKISNQGVWDFLSLNYILGNSSIVEGVRKLEPAHFMIIEKNYFSKKKYWHLKNYFINKKHYKNKKNAFEEFQNLLNQTVKKQMISDVKLGAFLSGGIDSSTIVASMCKSNKNKHVNAFCIGFNEKNYSEVEQSKYLSNFFSIKNFSLNIGSEIKTDFLNILDSTNDEPLGDTSILPMYYLTKFTKKHVTVSLSGDGADELFIGYETYVANKLKKITSLLPNPVLKNLSSLINFVLPVSHKKISFDYKVKQFLSGCTLSDFESHYWWRNIFSDSFKKKNFKNYNNELLSPLMQYKKFFNEVSDCDFIDQASYVDINTWLVDNVLVKLDRTSMSNSLECRSPFLNHKIVEFAASLPANWKMNKLKKKDFLKKSQQNILPNKILNAKKKGFNSPISIWFNNSLNKIAKDLTFSPVLTDLINKKSIQKLWHEHETKKIDNSFRLFGLACLSRWISTNKRN